MRRYRPEALPAPQPRREVLQQTQERLRVATRYDKTEERFLRFIDITSIRLRLRNLSVAQHDLPNQGSPSLKVDGFVPTS